MQIINNYRDIAQIATLLSLCYFQGEEDLLPFVQRHFEKQSLLSMALVDDQQHLVGVYFADVIPFVDGNLMQNGEFCVDPAYQKQWRGSKLFDAVIDEAVTNRWVVYHEMKLLNPFLLKQFVEGKGYKASKRFVLMSKGY